MLLRAFAKINLDLRVLGRRDDGYHEIKTIFQTVDWCDEIVLEPCRPLRVLGARDARKMKRILSCAPFARMSGLPGSRANVRIQPEEEHSDRSRPGRRQFGRGGDVHRASAAVQTGASVRAKFLKSCAISVPTCRFSRSADGPPGTAAVMKFTSLMTQRITGWFWSIRA